MKIDDEIHKKLIDECNKIKNSDSFKNEEQTIKFFRDLISAEQQQILYLIYQFDEDKYINHMGSILTAHFFQLTQDTDKARELSFKISLCINGKINGFEKELKKD